MKIIRKAFVKNLCATTIDHILSGDQKRKKFTFNDQLKLRVSEVSTGPHFLQILPRNHYLLGQVLFSII